MKTHSGLNRKVQLALAAALLTLLAGGTASYRGLVVSEGSDQWVRHTQEVLENLQQLLSAMENVESSFRGMILTGKESYLESYHANIAKAAQCELTIRRLTVDNSVQQRQLPALERITAQKVQFSDEIISLRRTKGLQAAADAIGDGPGQKIMDAFQLVIRDMRAEEQRLLALREMDARRRLDQTKAALVLGTLMGLFTTALAAWSMRLDSSGRALAAQKLRDSEEQYRSLIDGVLDYVILTLDPAGKVASWNAGAERIKGYKDAEIIGQNFSHFYLPTDIELGTPQQDLRVAATSGRSEVERWRVRKDGSQFWANVVITAVRDSSGRLLGFSEITRDISERKDTEAKYRGLLEAAPDAMVVVNGAGEIVLLNVRAEKQFGYHRDELVGQKVTNIIPEGFAERLIADGTRTAAEALAQQIGTGIELIARRKDGSTFPIEIMLSPLESSEGILVTAAIRDISEKKLIQEDIQQQQQLLQRIIESIADGVVVADCDGKFLLFNPAAKRCLGIGVTDIAPDQWSEQYGTYFPDTVTPIPSVDLPLMRALRGETVDSTEVFVRNPEVPDGRWLYIIGGPLRDDSGVLRGGVVVLHDITEHKKADEHLLKTVAELKRSNDELQQFAYVASHDLQEPLRMVASYTQLLAKRYSGRLDADADEFMAYAVNGANRMQGMIRDLLAYSRAGTEGNAPHEISSENALQVALVNLQATITESRAVVTHDALPVIVTDENQLVQVFQNLVGNAIKYRGAATPRVHVSASKNGGQECIFSVRDNGLGIDPRYFEKIFVLFQRLHGQTEFQGTGIGLTICKKIVERLGGRIWVQSQLGSGSTFLFALPDGVVK
jgi:PAS domain S-box-containing protein